MTPPPGVRAPATAIRPAASGDLAALADLEATCFAEPWPRHALEAELRLSGSIVVVADGGGEVAGFAVFRHVPGEGELLRLAVRSGRRRSGIASALLAAGLERLEALGAERCFLEVRTTNGAALAFYRATGFVPVGRRPRYYADGTDALLLACPLAAAAARA